MLRSLEEMEAERQEEEARRRRAEQDRERLALIEKRERRVRDTAPYFERFGTGDRPVRHYDPDAVTRHPRLRALGDVLLGGAWVALGLAIMGAGWTIWLRFESVVPSTGVLMVLLVGWALVGLLSFLGLKLLAELAQWGAWTADRQHDIVQLLRDLEGGVGRTRDDASGEAVSEGSR